MGAADMLEVDDLTVRFSGLTALSGVSFSVGPGTILAIIGPNGSGKTTLFNAVTGFVRPTGGDIRFKGASVAGLPPHRIAARGICRTFQNNGLCREMTVLENVLTGLELTTPSSLWGAALGLPASARAEREAVERARDMLAQRVLDHLAERPVADLSFGQQRQVEIARALVGDAQLLLLDEPAVGLSPAERTALADDLIALADEGIAVVLVEHQQDLVMAVARRVLVLNHGRKIAEALPHEIRADAAVLEAYLGQEFGDDEFGDE